MATSTQIASKWIYLAKAVPYEHTLGPQCAQVPVDPQGAVPGLALPDGLEVVLRPQQIFAGVLPPGSLAANVKMFSDCKRATRKWPQILLPAPKNGTKTTTGDVILVFLLEIGWLMQFFINEGQLFSLRRFFWRPWLLNCAIFTLVTLKHYHCSKQKIRNQPWKTG